MATVAHCLFCFDVLASSLEKKKPLSLTQVQDLWTAFESEKEKEKEKETTIYAHDGGNDLEYKEEDSASAAVEEEIEQVTVAAAAATTNKKLLNPTSIPSIRFPGISRLRDLSGSSSSSSSGSSTSLGSGSRSNSSTPSTLSTASSRSALTDNTSVSSSATSATSISSSSASPASGSGSSSRRPYNFLGKREEEYPLFVTWNTISVYSGTKSLRGCIGTFDPTELSVGLKNYALTAYV